MQQSLVKGLNLSNYPLQHKCLTKKKGLVKIMHTLYNLEAKLHCNHKCPQKTSKFTAIKVGCDSNRIHLQKIFIIIGQWIPKPKEKIVL
jgi:hypothetical protein